MICLETPRLILRNFVDKDFSDVYEFLSQRKEDFYEGYPDINEENAKEHLNYRLNTDDFIALESKENGKVIGNLYFASRDFQSKELGYIINKNYQRKGLAYEAITVLLPIAFQQGVHRVFAECAPQNECSWRLLEKLGFQREACFHQNIYFHKDEKGLPIWQDTYVYALLNHRD